MSETLSQLTTQVNLLYSSCNSISQSVQQLLESQVTYNGQVTELFSEVQSLSAQQTTNLGNINLLNSEVAQLIYYQNLSILSQNNTTFKAATLSNSNNIVTSPISLNGSISGNISYIIIGNNNYNKIIYYLNDYESNSQTFQFPSSLENPIVSSNLTSSEYTVSTNGVTFNATSSPINGYLVIEGLISGNTLTPIQNAPTSGSYQLLLINEGQYKKYLILFNNYLNDSGNTSTISFELPYSNLPFSQNFTNGNPVVALDGISIPSSTNLLNGYFLLEGW